MPMPLYDTLSNLSNLGLSRFRTVLSRLSRSDSVDPRSSSRSRSRWRVLLLNPLSPDYDPEGVKQFYLGVIGEHQDLLVAIAVVLLAYLALGLLVRTFRLLFAPYSKSWTSPSTRPKRYPADVLSALPGPYPNGWYRLASISAIAPGEIKEFELCGRTIVLVRARGSDVVTGGRTGSDLASSSSSSSSDGPVFRAFDARCPHLGANLALGRLKDGCIECPFHGWRFDLRLHARFGDQGCGELREVPYLENGKESVPEGARRVDTYETEVVNGGVVVWIDAENRRGSAIPFRPYAHPSLPPTPSSYFYHGETVHYIRAHISELPENGSDLSHFKYTHEPSLLRFLPFLTHDMTGKYDTSGNPVLELTVIHILRAWGFPISRTETKVVQCGPGYATLHLQSPLGEIVITESIVPVAPLLIRTTHTCHAKWTVPRFLAKMVFAGMVAQYDRDAMIFDGKMPLPQPAFVKSEGAMVQYRRWWKQFYGPRSVGMESALKEYENGVVGGGGNWRTFEEVEGGCAVGRGGKLDW